MQTEMNEKLQELVNNKDYVQHILSLGSAEEMSKELEKEDIDISPEELRQVYSLIKKKESGELTEEELQEVAGGLGLVGSLVIFGIMQVIVGATGGIITAKMCK